jgi:hypothetical protein
MYSMEQNDAFEAALNVAFKKHHDGKASLVFEEGTCKIVLKNGTSTEVVTLKNGDASIYFFHNESGTYGKVKGTPERFVNWYIVGFGNGLLKVDTRQSTTQISYQPSTRYSSQRTYNVDLPRFNR